MTGSIQMTIMSRAFFVLRGIFKIVSCPEFSAAQNSSNARSQIIDRRHVLLRTTVVTFCFAIILTKKVLLTMDFKDNMSNASGGNKEDDVSRSSGNTPDGGSANGSTSTDQSPSSKNSSHQSDVKSTLGRRETQGVTRLRVLVVLVLLAAAAGVSALVLMVSMRAEDDEMSGQFESASTRLLESFASIREDKIASLASLAVAAIAHGVDHSRDWPFVSLSAFDQRSYPVRDVSGILQVSIAPLVTQANRQAWEEYVISDEADVDWVERTIDYQAEVGFDHFIKDYGEAAFRKSNATHLIHGKDEATGKPVEVPDSSQPRYLPVWENAPLLRFDDINVDLMQSHHGTYGDLCLQEGGIVLGDMDFPDPGGINSTNFETSTYAQVLSISAQEITEYKGDPMTSVFIPIFDSFQDGRVPTAVMIGLFNWGNLFRNVLPDGVNGVDLVLHNKCYSSFTYRVNGEDVLPVGPGDQHVKKFDDWEVRSGFLEVGKTADGTKNGLGFVDRECHYFISIYPSEAFEDVYKTSTPWILVSAVGATFLFAIGMFFVYDRLVERRQTLVLQKAVQSSAIVSSLFPKAVQDRLMNNTDNANKAVTAFRDKVSKNGEGFDQNSSYNPSYGEEQTIADLFPNCTVMFADICGFTAWSSTREPTQVFTLLQNLYQAFDKIAQRRRVFKVETIGDSYVAATGLPEPQDDHAIIMAKFARDCLVKMKEVTAALEVRLGPDTTDLDMRFGLNSGQVTGGVLRGDRARFQLFGDTVNTAARMESTGMRGGIQLSQSTADLLLLAGKERWIRPREDTVTAKGKGTMQTYWLVLEGAHQISSGSDIFAISEMTSGSGNIGNASRPTSTIDQFKQSGLAAWMTEVLLDYVKQIVAKNIGLGVENNGGKSSLCTHIPTGTICLDEMVESFDLPGESKDVAVLEALERYRSVELDQTVVSQLTQYVADIASRYHPSNPFHNFQHACHVTMSVHKLMKRVVTDGSDAGRASNTNMQPTYGILTSDPLTLFAIVFAGLIHDVDHRGVSNMQLAKESPQLAEHYRNKSLAEQNSFDIAWDLLMTKQNEALRRAIFPTAGDLMRFRQVVINTVLATDIFDKELGDMRKERWNRVFGGVTVEKNEEDDLARNTRATIVLEHIIQASDVSHTMQHWHVYVKWNRKLYEEMYLAFKQGRMAKDPSAFWYEGELGFYDNYVIPLAKKLQECQVFGVSSAEYLNYALSNRKEWEDKGKQMVEEMMKEVQQRHVGES